MHKKVLYSLFFLLFFWLEAKTQVSPPCSNPPPQGGSSCGATCVYCDFDGYSGNTSNGAGASIGGLVCGNIVVHNDQWLGFVATEPTMEIVVTSSNCTLGDGVQLAFFASCGTNNALICNSGGNDLEGIPLTLFYDQFVPGQTYYLMIDGSNGDVCDFDVDITQGSVVPPPVGFPDVPVGPTALCPGATGIYTISPVAGASFYRWSAPAGARINGSLVNPLTLPASTGTTVTITFGNTPLNGNVCVTVGNACSTPNQACLPVQLTNLPITMKPHLTLCYEDRVFHNPEAPFTMTTLPVGNTTLNATYDSYLGCDSIVRQTITVLPQNIKPLGTKYICQGSCFVLNGQSYCTPGNQQQQVVLDNGCDTLLTFNLILLPAVANIQAVPPINCAMPNVTLSSSGSTAPSPSTTYRWTNSTWGTLGTGINQNVSGPGSYNLVITTIASGTTCRDTATVTVTSAAAFPGANATGGSITCSSPNVTLLSSSPASGVTYSWSGPGITPANQFLQNPTVSTAGTYTISVTNPVNSCTSTATAVVVPNDTLPTATAVGGTVSCTQPSIILDGGSNIPNAGYTWTGPGITAGNLHQENPSVTVAGSYTLTVVNPVNSCSRTATTTVNTNNSLPVASAGTDQNINCQQSSVTLNGSATGGGTLQYSWTGPGITPANQNLQTPVVTAGGAYILSVLNTTNGCADTDTVQVSQLTTPPVASAGVDRTLNCGVLTAVLDGSGSSQGANLSALWSGPGINAGNQNSYSPTVNAAGTYTVTITNSVSQCSATDIVQVTMNNAVPTVNAGTDQILTCSSTNGVTLNGSGGPTGVTYLWMGPDINAGNQSIPNPVIDIQGTYTLQITNPVNQCTATDQMVVSQDANAPIAMAGSDQVLNCTVTSVSIGASGTSSGAGITYLWTGPGITPATQNQLMQTISDDGTYILQVNNANNGCSSSDAVIVTEQVALPTAAAGNDGTLNCAVQNIILDGTGSSQGAGFSILWTGPDINAGNQNTYSPQIDLPGVYTLTVTNTTNNCTATDNVTILQDNANPTVNAGTDQVLTCTTQSGISLNGSGGPASVTYLWTGPDINAGNQSIPNPMIDVPGTYTLRITNPVNQCTATDQVVVSQDTIVPVAMAGSDQVLNCTVTSVSIGSSGTSSGAGISYLWTGPGITPANQNQLMPTISDDGTYMLQVNNANNGCSSSDAVIVTEQVAVPTAAAGNDGTLNCTVQNIILDGAGSSQGAGFTILWTGPDINAGNQNTYSPQIDLPGVYTLTVTNTTNNCTATDNVTILQDNANPTVNAGTDEVLTCTTQSGISLNGSGSPASITYLWSGPGINAGNQNMPNPTIADPGPYTLVVTNTVNNCTATDQVVITEDANVPLANAGTDLTITCSVNSVNIDASASTAGAGIEYTWTGPGISGANATAQNPQNITSPGTYFLTVTNTTNSCTNTASVLIGIDTIRPLSSAGNDLTLNCFNDTADTLDASGSSTGAGFTLLWTGPGITAATQNLPKPVVDQAGLYTVLITNTTNNCTSSSDATVTADTLSPIADAGIDGTIDCANSAVPIGGNSSSGSSFEYLWTGPDIDQNNESLATLNVDMAGAYNLQVTNTTNGCTAVAAVLVAEDVAYPLASAGTDTVITCTNGTITLDAAASSSGAGIQILWSGQSINAGNESSVNPNVTAPDLYILTITNTVNSCVSIDSVLVQEDTQLPDALAGADALLNCQTTSTILDGSGSSAGTGITYLWTGPGITTANEAQQSPSVDEPGIYNLVVTNTDNGCVAQDDLEVLEDVALPVADAGLDLLLDCQNPAQPIDGSGSSTGAGVEYLWQGPGINSGNFNVPSPMVGDSGTYVVTVTFTANHCTATDFVFVSESADLPITSAGVDQTLNCATDTLQLDGASSQGGANITYAWSGPGIVGGETALNSPNIYLPGNYTLTVTNTDNGCSNTDLVTVLQDTIPPLVLAGDDQTLTCANSTTGVTLTSAGSSSGPEYVIQWSGSGITPANESLPNPQVTGVGPYVLLITNNDNGCTQTDAVTVLQDQDAPTSVAGEDQTITCAVGQVSLDGSGSSSPSGVLEYTWSGPGINAGNEHDATISVDDSGNYTLTIVNPVSGCQATDNVEVLLDTDPPTASASGDTITCQSPMGTLSVTSSDPGSLYAWAGLGITPGNANQSTLQVNQPGNYSVTVTAVNGCTTVLSTLMDVDSNFPIGVADGDQLNCLNSGNGTISGSVTTPGATFFWSGPNGFNATTETVAVTVAGTYTFNVVAVNGCINPIAVTVSSDFTEPTVMASVAGNLNCTVTSLSISGTGTSAGGNYSYDWTAATGGNIVSGENTLAPVVDAPGNYTLLVTNLLNGCTNSESVLVANDPNVPTALDLTVRDIKCFGDKNGVIAVTAVNGGLEPFVFSLNGATSSTVDQFSNLPAGEYLISMEDANGCLLDTIVNIDEPGQLQVELGEDMTVHLGDSVSVNAEITNEIPVQDVKWNFDPNRDSTDCCSFSYQPLQTYRHEVVVQDENGCVARDVVTINVKRDRQVFIPNIFDLNSDDPLSAVLMIQGGRDVVKVHSWLIFDRWGDAVFEVYNFLPNDPAYAWNGTVRGEKGQPSVFVFMAEIEFLDGQTELFEGDVTIIR